MRLDTQQLFAPLSSERIYRHSLLPWCYWYGGVPSKSTLAHALSPIEDGLIRSRTMRYYQQWLCAARGYGWPKRLYAIHHMLCCRYRLSLITAGPLLKTKPRVVYNLEAANDMLTWQSTAWLCDMPSSLARKGPGTLCKPLEIHCTVDSGWVLLCAYAADNF